MPALSSRPVSWGTGFHLHQGTTLTMNQREVLATCPVHAARDPPCPINSQSFSLSPLLCCSNNPTEIWPSLSKLRILEKQILDLILPGSSSPTSVSLQRALFCEAEDKSSPMAPKEAGPALPTDNPPLQCPALKSGVCSSTHPTSSLGLTSPIHHENHHMAPPQPSAKAHHVESSRGNPGALSLPLACRPLMTPLYPWRLQLSLEPVTTALLWLNNKFLLKTVKMKTSDQKGLRHYLLRKWPPFPAPS